MKSLGFQKSSSVNWWRKVIEKDEAKLDGELVDSDGQKRKVAVVMLRQSGQWRLHSLHLVGDDRTAIEQNPFTLIGKGASYNEALRREMPADKEIRQLVLKTILDFQDGIQKESFSNFYNSVSLAWQAQVSEHRFQTAFQGFIDAKVDLSGAKGVEAVFDAAPEINGEGLLVVLGRYPVAPHQIVFSMKFTYELPHWRLFGLTVDLVKANSP